MKSQEFPNRLEEEEEEDLNFEFDSIEKAIESFKSGECIIVLDDLERENEGDLILAGEKVTTEKMAWIIKHSSGYVCVALTGNRLDELNIPLMIEDNQEKYKTAYTHTIDYKLGTTTGISAKDRALTVLGLCDEKSQAQDFSRPGHMVPLRAKDGGINVRRGHTEAAIDLCKLSGLKPIAILSELVKPDCLKGSMAKPKDCFKFSKEFNLKIISIENLLKFKNQQNQKIQQN